MKLFQTFLYSYVLIMVMVIWVVPMSYGHGDDVPMTGDKTDTPVIDGVTDPPTSNGDAVNVPAPGDVPSPPNGGYGTDAPETDHGVSGPPMNNGDGVNVRTPGDVRNPSNGGHGTDESVTVGVPDPPSSNGDGVNVPPPGDVPNPPSVGLGTDALENDGEPSPRTSNGDGVNVPAPGDVPNPPNSGHETDVPVTDGITGPPTSNDDEVYVPAPGDVSNSPNGGHGTDIPMIDGVTGPPTNNGDEVKVPAPSDVPYLPNSSDGMDAGDGWHEARATFYGDINGAETQQGACGYGDLDKQGYGLATAALSTALFNNGYTCGACYEIKCVNSPQWCLPGSIKITATNFCPPDYKKTQDCWCNPPQKHFDLSQPMFLKIAMYKAGVVPVRYRRVPCMKTGGVKFEIKGNPYFLMILPYNVGGAGDIKAMCIKGTKTEWITMKKNWGQIWTTGVVLTGQRLSFRITTSDGVTKDFMDATPPTWGCSGQSFDGKINF